MTKKMACTNIAGHCMHRRRRYAICCWCGQKLSLRELRLYWPPKAHGWHHP